MQEKNNWKMLKRKIILKGISISILILTVLFYPMPVDGQTGFHHKLLSDADSLFQLQLWKPARVKYEQYLTDSVSRPMPWNRLGYCYYNLGLYQQAIKSYEKALTLLPATSVKAIIELRMSRVYGRLRDENKQIEWLEKSARSGYQDINEINKPGDFDLVRNSPNFKKVYQKIYENAYPCAADPKQREFDFWIGEWDVFQNGTSQVVGHSVVQKVSGECALLENWESARATNNGKSLNYYDVQSNSWEQDWVGSMGGAQRYLNGIYRDSAMRFTYESINNGKKVTGNLIFYNMGPGKVRQFQDVSEDGKTFTTSFDFIYIRKK
ncbi:MAG: tetratricopeptide repeat protein [Chitinophagaceae bacterium]